MKRLVESFALVIACGGVLAVMFQVLVRNLAAGIYPVDADSLGIPLFEALLVSLLTWLSASAAIVLFGRRRWLSWAALALFALAAALPFLYGLSWLDKNHWEIALSYIAIAAVLSWRVVVRFRQVKVRSNEP